MNTAIETTIGKLFVEYSEEKFIEECANYVGQVCGCPISASNRRSWGDCFRFLKNNINSPEFWNYPILFEYMMVDSERRPDVIILCQDKVVILEFKEKCRVTKTDIAQAAAYKKDIKYFHHQTAYQNLLVESYLVYTVPNSEYFDFPHLVPENFSKGLRNILTSPMDTESKNKWINSIFEPLKSVADATCQLFQTGELPNIKSIREGHIQDCLNAINEISNQKNQKSIIFVEGVPGSGKTLVGIKTVYDTYMKDESKRPIYLSGNFPLVDILQNSLSLTGYEGKSFIQHMKDFKRHNSARIPVYDLIVFDEAQRAWDEFRNGGVSEPETLLRILNSKQSVTLICLIGTGQAIHTGEEIGMPLWRDALSRFPEWNVFFTRGLSTVLNGMIDDRLYLDTSIRNDFIDVAPLIEAILNSEFDKAHSIYAYLVKQGYSVYLVNQKEQLPMIVNHVKRNNSNDHVGILVSSHSKDESIFPTGYRGQANVKKPWPWYSEQSELLTLGATEFLVQGIELEWPIVTFGGDYYIENNRWVVDPNLRNKGSNYFNFPEIVKNVYRVLLTRSRKGMYIYIPYSIDKQAKNKAEERKKIQKFKETWEILFRVFTIE